MENMGWKVVMGTVLIALGVAIQSIDASLPALGIPDFLGGMISTIGILLGGIGLRVSQAKVLTKLDRLESKVDVVKEEVKKTS